MGKEWRKRNDDTGRLRGRRRREGSRRERMRKRGWWRRDGRVK